MIVLGGSASNGLDSGLAKALGARLEKIETTKFPDGEIKVRVPEVKKGEQVVVVQSTCYPQEKNIFELVFTGYALKEKKAKVCAVIPYLAYARQNKSFADGEAVSIDAVIDMLKLAGISSLVVVNPHKHESLDHFKGKVEIVNCARSLAKGVKRRINDPFVLAPDKSALKIAKPAAEAMDADYAYIEKKRDDKGNVTIVKADGGKVKGRNVVIFDDMVAAGSTIELSARFAYEQGAASVSVAAIHLLMVNNAYDRLKAAGVKHIFGANTIPFDRAEIIDVSAEVADGVKSIFKK